MLDKYSRTSSGTFVYDDFKKATPYSPLSGTTPRPIKASHNYRDDILIDDAVIPSISLYTEDDQMRHIQTFARRLAAEYLDGVQLRNMGWSIPELRDLLKHFADRLYDDSQIPFHRQISTMMYHKNALLVKALTETKDTQTISTSGLPIAKFSREDWEQQVYESFLCGSGAYRWLLSKLYERRVLPTAHTEGIDGFRAKIVDNLPGRKFKDLGEKDALSILEMTFHLNWDPEAYLRHLGLFPPTLETWEMILCLTGSWDEAQAVTVAEYVHQTWPVNGNRLLTFLNGLMDVSKGVQYSEKASRFNWSTFVGSIVGNDRVSITIKGDRRFVTDAAEQMAWLAATLRMSSQKDKLRDVNPFITDVSVPDELNTFGGLVLGTCWIDFIEEPISEASEHSSGLCWLGLFINSILVRGYPIPCRSTQQNGLDISLKAMASLVGSTQVVQYEDRLMMKGFNSLLVATSTEDGMVLWHAIVNGKADERISYFDSRVDALHMSHEGAPTLRTLENSRHIIGWCSEAVDFCGHPDSTLNVTTSRLPPPPSSTYIDRLYVEAGLYFIAGVNMHVNQKERSTQLGRASDYPSMLNWVSKQFLAFYDVSARRAWLVDGASALLHLVRISLHLDETDPESVYDWTWGNEKSNMKEDWTSSIGRRAALNTLKDWTNYDLHVYVKAKSKGTSDYSTFGERVEKVLHDLEILVDLQVWLASPSGIKVAQELDSHKEISGFDIRDLLSPPGPIARRTARFDSRGGGWYDLLPSLGVVTIFGKDFGQLIRPEDAGRVCPEWQSIPKGHDFLVSTVSTLKHLYDKRFDGQYPATSKMSWRAPKNQRDTCECVGQQQESSDQKHYDPAHFIVSNSLLQNWRLKDSAPVEVRSLNPKGAIVFANLSLTGQRMWMKNSDADKLKPPNTTRSASSSTGARSLNPLDSMAASTITQSAASTDATDLSSDVADEMNLETGSRELGKGKGRRDKMRHFFGSLKKR